MPIKKAIKSAAKYASRNKGKDVKDLSKKDKALVAMSKGLTSSQKKRKAATKSMVDAVKKADPNSAVTDREYKTAMVKLKKNKDKNEKLARRQNY